MHVNPNPYYYQYFPPGHHPAPPPTYSHLSESIAVSGVPVTRGETPAQNQPYSLEGGKHQGPLSSSSCTPLTTSNSAKETVSNAHTCTDCQGDSLPALDPGGDFFVRSDIFTFDSNASDVPRPTKWLQDFRDIISLQKYKERPKYQNVLNVHLDSIGLVYFSVILLTSTQSLIQDKSRGPMMSLLLYAKSNPQLCYLFECNESRFGSIKEEQNLKITFAQFPDKMTEILMSIPSQYEIKIASLSRLDQTDKPSIDRAKANAVLSIFESNEFRVYNHLSLGIRRLHCCDTKKILNHEMLIFQNFALCLSSRLEQAMAAASDLQAQVQKLREEKHGLITQHVADLQAYQEEASAESESLKGKYKESLQDLENEKNNLRSQLQVAEHEAESMRLELHRMGLIEVEHRGCLAVLQEKKELITKTAVLAAKLADKDETIEALKVQVKEYEAMKTKYTLFEAEASDGKMAKVRLEEKTEQMNAYKERNRTLQAKLKEAEDMVSDLESKFDEARREIEELKSEFSDRNQAYNVNAQMLEKKDLRIQQLEIEYEKMCQANFELNRRLTDSIVRNAKRQQPEHFRSDTSSIDRILFPEKSDTVEASVPNMPAIPSVHAHPGGGVGGAKSTRSHSQQFAAQPGSGSGYVPQSASAAPASQPIPVLPSSSMNAHLNGGMSTPQDLHRFPTVPHSATVNGSQATASASGTLDFSFAGQKKAKNAFNIRRSMTSQRGSL